MQPSNFLVGVSWVPKLVCCALGKPQPDTKKSGRKKGGRTGALEDRLAPGLGHTQFYACKSALCSP